MVYYTDERVQLLLAKERDLNDISQNMDELKNKLIDMECRYKSASAKSDSLQSQNDHLREQLNMMNSMKNDSIESSEESIRLKENILVLQNTVKDNISLDDERRESILQKDIKINQLESEVSRFQLRIQQIEKDLEESRVLNIDLSNRIVEPKRTTEIALGSNTNISRDSDALTCINKKNDLSRQSLFSGEDMRMSTFNIRDSQVNRFANRLGESTNFSKRKDLLNLSSNLKLSDLLDKSKLQRLTNECMTDSVFIQDNKGRKHRYNIIITVYNIMIVNPKNMSMVYINTLDRITKITIGSRSCTFISIRLSNSDQLVVESYRRIDVIAYIAHIFKEKNIPLFKVVVTKNIEIRHKRDKKNKEPVMSKDTPVLKENEKVNRLVDGPQFQDAIRNSVKSGFMKKQSKGLFNRSSYEEYFFLLSNIGMVYFKKYGDLKSTGYIPILGCVVKHIDKSIIRKDNIISINAYNTEYILQCYSAVDMNDWLLRMKSVQDSSIGTKDTIKEMKKVL